MSVALCRHFSLNYIRARYWILRGHEGFCYDVGNAILDEMLSTLLTPHSVCQCHVERKGKKGLGLELHS